MNKKHLKYLSLFVVPIMLYLVSVIYMQDKFLFNTKVGDIDVSLKTLQETRELIKEEIIGNYVIQISAINGEKVHITGKEIALDIETKIEPFFNAQNKWKWPLVLSKEQRYPLEYEITFDEHLLDEKIKNCIFYQDEHMEDPENAYISEYTSGKGYEIIPETKGSRLIKDKTSNEIENAIRNLKESLSLEEKECYESAKITKDSAFLIEELKKKNPAVSASITYDFGNEKIHLTPDIYHEWIDFSKEKISIDEDKAKEYVEELIKKTDTAYTDREFKTSSGNVVMVTGPYGYRIAPNDERTQMISDILSGENIIRKPIYTREGATREKDDYGNTYVEIDLTTQRVYLYVNGELIKSSDCVTGNVSKGHTTPPGIYPMTYKEKNAVLRGPGYASPVKFWMPFNGGIGLHDASWRSKFGGEIYKTNGSHGCINLPYDMAKTIYDNAYAGMPVICYN